MKDFFKITVDGVDYSVAVEKQDEQQNKASFQRNNGLGGFDPLTNITTTTPINYANHTPANKTSFPTGANVGYLQGNTSASPIPAITPVSPAASSNGSSYLGGGLNANNSYNSNLPTNNNNTNMPWLTTNTPNTTTPVTPNTPNNTTSNPNTTTNNYAPTAYSPSTPYGQTPSYTQPTASYNPYAPTASNYDLNNTPNFSTGYDATTGCNPIDTVAANDNLNGDYSSWNTAPQTISWNNNDLDFSNTTDPIDNLNDPMLGSFDPAVSGTDTSLATDPMSIGFGTGRVRPVSDFAFDLASDDNTNTNDDLFTTNIGNNSVLAPTSGTIDAIYVSVGDQVRAGDVLCMLEIEGIKSNIISPVDAQVVGVFATVGCKVDSHDILISLT